MKNIKNKRQVEEKQLNEKGSMTPISKLLKVVNYDVNSDCFYHSEGYYFDFIKIISKDWQNKTEDEAALDIARWCRFYRTYGDDLKIITLNFKMVTHEQQEYVKRRLENQKNTQLRRCLIRKLKELEDLEKYNTSREFYLMFFGKSKEDLNKNRMTIFNNLSNHIVSRMGQDKKFQILYKLCNKNMNVKPVNFEPIELEKSTDVDKALMRFISPQGRISFRDERIIKSGTGYEMCIHVYGYPIMNNRFWLTNVCNINNVVTTIDIGTDDMIEVKKNINKSINEQYQRGYYGSNFGEMYDAQMRANELKDLYHEIESLGEVIKLIHTRIFATGKTINEVEIAAKKIMDNLEASNYDAAVFLNESRHEWETMFMPFEEQNNDKAFSIEAQEIKSMAVAGGMPFYFSSLEDKYGTILGYTPCRGNVLFDLYAATEKRTHFNAVVFGGMGSGKSSLLKKQFYDRAARGDFVRTFDITGEFRELTNKVGGRFLKLDGTSGIINPLEILTGSETEAGNYAIHISKVSTFYKLFSSSTTREEIDTFEELVNELYVKFGFIENKGYNIVYSEQLSGLPANKYPIFSDLIELADENIKKLSDTKNNVYEMQLISDKIKRIDRVKRTIQNLVVNFGTLVNGPTSFDNITDTQIVTFDISTLRNMKSEIFDALIFNALSLCWGNAVKNGKVMKELYETQKVALEDVIHTLIIIDESHNWINTKKMAAVEQVTLFAREGRKFFTGIMLASQSIRDYVPEDSSEAGINSVKILFELSQYKFIFRQDNNAMRLLETIFRNQLTVSELEQIPELERGQCILSIASDINVAVDIELTDDELEIFRGGV